MGEREERFARLFASAYGPVWAYARRRVPADDIEDVVSETLAIVWRRLDDVPDGEGSLPWIYGVAHKTIGNALRSRRRRLRLMERLRREPAATPERHGSAGVLEAFSDLPTNDQEILRLAAWEGLTPAEIAVVLRCSPNAAALRLSRARKKLRERMTGSEPFRTQQARKEIDV